MALSIKINTLHEVDANHTVGFAQGSNVSASSSSTSLIVKTTHTLAPNSGVQATVVTVTFTAATDHYYSIAPEHTIRSPYPNAYQITQTTAKDSSGKVISRVFVIKYTNTTNSSGDAIVFDHETNSKRKALDTHNNSLVQIDSFEIDSSDIISTGGVKYFCVKGDQNAYFNLKITKANGSSADTTYDFTSATFTSTVTQLKNVIIDQTGEYSSQISIPSTSADDVYTLELSPSFELGTTISKSLQDSTNEFLCTKTINQYKIITITIKSGPSASYSGSYGSLPDNVVIKAERGSIQPIDVNINWDYTLSANSFTIVRGGSVLGGINSIDLRSTVIKVKDGNQAASTTVELDDVDSLLVGMAMTGTRVTGAPRIVSINKTDKNIVVSVSQNAQNNSGMADDDDISFTYGGSFLSETISGLKWRLLNTIAAQPGYTKNSTTLSPVKTAVNNSSGINDSATVVVDDAAGIKATATTFVSGLGIDAKTVAPHVDAVSSDTLTLSAAQTLEDNTPLVFTGSSRSSNISFSIQITNIGTKDHTMTFFLDNSLLVG